MSKLKNIVENAAAIVYFAVIMFWVLLLMLFSTLGLSMDLNRVIKSGFSGTNVGCILVVVLGLFIGLSLLVPSFRKMYYALPWLFPFVKIFYINIIILTAAALILNYGFEVKNKERHTVFMALMAAFIIISRLFMCWYFHKKPVRDLGGESFGR